MSEPSTILLVIYSLCNGIGVPLVALAQAVHRFNQGQNHLKLEIHTTFVYETNALANTINHRMLKRGNAYPGHLHYCGDLDQFPRDVVTHGSLLAPLNVVAVVLTGTPCKSVSSGCRMNPNRNSFGIHASPSNLWFTAHRGLVELQCRMECRMITFIENVVPGNRSDLQVFDQMAGHRHSMNVPTHQGAPRPRYIWTNVHWRQCIPLPTRHDATVSCATSARKPLPTGWHYTHQSKGLPCLRAIFPRLFWQYANEDETLTNQDNMTVQQCLLFHEPSEDIRLPPLDIWGDQLGLNMYHIQECIRAAPCHKHITVHPTTSSYYSTTCGRVAYCGNCSDIVAALGEAWHLDVAEAHLFKTLASFFAEPFCPPTFIYNQPCHWCTEACHLASNTFV